jgi:hypothetical protein
VVINDVRVQLELQDKEMRCARGGVRGRCSSRRVSQARLKTRDKECRLGNWQVNATIRLLNIETKREDFIESCLWMVLGVYYLD